MKGSTELRPDTPNLKAIWANADNVILNKISATECRSIIGTQASKMQQTLLQALRPRTPMTPNRERRIQWDRHAYGPDRPQAKVCIAKIELAALVPTIPRASDTPGRQPNCLRTRLGQRST